MLLTKIRDPPRHRFQIVPFPRRALQEMDTLERKAIRRWFKVEGLPNSFIAAPRSAGCPGLTPHERTAPIYLLTKHIANVTSPDPTMQDNELALLATETKSNLRRLAMNKNSQEKNFKSINPDIPFYNWTKYYFTTLSSTNIVYRMANFANIAQSLHVGLCLNTDPESGTQSLSITRHLPGQSPEAFISAKSLQQALLATLEADLTKELHAADVTYTRQIQPTERMRPKLMFFGCEYPAHTAVLSTPYFWDMAYHRKHSDREIALFLRMRTNNIRTPLLKSLQGDSKASANALCPHIGCTQELTVEHILNNTHSPSNSPLINQTQAAISQRHPSVIELLHRLVTANLRHNCHFVCGDQMNFENSPAVSNHLLDNQVRSLLQRGKKRIPDCLLRVASPTIGSHLVWIEFTCTADAHISEEDTLFSTKWWRESSTTYDASLRQSLTQPFDPTTYPYSCWSPDGPNAARRTPPDKPQFEFPHAAPSEVPYSPRGKILHRTILKRRELLRSLGLETRMVVIEVGPKAYVSKLSLEELHAHVKPLLRPPHTVTSLIKGIVEAMITSTCEVGTIMNRHGMY